MPKEIFMFKKLIAVILFWGCFAVAPLIAETPLITGVPMDEELTGLLSQVVPYQIDGEDVLPKEGRFLFELNRLINEDLKEQSDEYKRAACKLALQTALAINKTVDSIEVRRNNYNGHHSLMRASDGRFFWILGGNVEEPTKWRIEGHRVEENNMDGGVFHHLEVTVHLFILKEGEIIYVDPFVSANACGGMFSSCCDYSAEPDGLYTDVWLRSLIDITKQEDSSIAVRCRLTFPVIKYLSEQKLENLDLPKTEILELRYHPFRPDDLAHLAILKDLSYVSIGIHELKDIKAIREASLDLFQKLPRLQTIRVANFEVIKRP